MSELQPAFLTSLCYTFNEFRRFTAGFVSAGGVSDRGSLKVTTAGSGLGLSVAPGQGFIVGTDDPVLQGTYFVSTDTGSVTLTATTADATNPRIDRVVATVRDSDYGGVDNDWVVQIIPGTPTVGATLSNLSGVAALPDDSIDLAYVLVPASFAGPFVDATHILDSRNIAQSGLRTVHKSTRWSRTTNQSFADATEATITYPVAAAGSAEGNDWVTMSSGVVTVKRAGLLLVVAGAGWAPHASATRRRIRISLNGNVEEDHAQSGPSNNSGALRTAQSVTRVINAAVGDTIEVVGIQNSGGALNIERASLTITDLGPVSA